MRAQASLLLRLVLVILMLWCAVGFAKEQEENCQNPEAVVEVEGVANEEEIQTLEGESPAIQGKEKKKKKKKAQKDEPDMYIVQWVPDQVRFKGSYDCSLGRCEVTEDRKKLKHPKTRGVIWYAPNLDFVRQYADDLPLPRLPRHEWIVWNDESPCSYMWLQAPACMSLYNVSAMLMANATWPQMGISDFTRHNEGPSWLQGRKPVPLAEKNRLRKEKGYAPVLYIQSNCMTPFKRDEYVKELMKHIEVDSYGKCLHNKDLPPDIAPWHKLESEEFFDYVANYKFTLSFENCRCTDYVTEKLFRPLRLGSIPIYMGTSNVKDWAPGPKSIISTDDFASPAALAEFIKLLDSDDARYEQWLTWKTADLSDTSLAKRWKDLYSHGWWSEKRSNTGMCKVCDEIMRRAGVDPTGADYISGELKGSILDPHKHVCCQTNVFEGDHKMYADMRQKFCTELHEKIWERRHRKAKIAESKE